MTNGLKNVPLKNQAGSENSSKRPVAMISKVINGLSHGATCTGFHSDPYSKDCEKPEWKKVIFANQHSKVLECTQSL